ncbi:MAG: IclR family transcriptional regulator [Deltaproteobacteria bacterium]|nr:MAG: IclR family transcriptional regulator [Deltaproteobacteria bacterium]
MSRTGREKSSYVIQSVVNALNLLEQFIHSEGELGVTELSKRLGLHKNNVFRLLATLESKGYIEQNKATENYRLGIKSLELGQTYIHQMGLVHHAHPVMEELAQKCQENVYLGIVQENAVVYLDMVEANQVVRVASRIGQQLPIHCSSIGKVQIAFMNESELERLKLKNSLKRYTPNTITDYEKLKKHLEGIRKLGYSIDNGEYDEGVRCVAVPIRDYTRQIVAGLSISGPVFRMTDENLEKRIIPEILKAGREISKRLGFDIPNFQA